MKLHYFRMTLSKIRNIAYEIRLFVDARYMVTHIVLNRNTKEYHLNLWRQQDTLNWMAWQFSDQIRL